MEAKIMTAQELLEIARQGKPGVKYVTDDKEQAIGAWNEEHGRYVQVAGLLVTGEWASLPFELCVNGEPVHHNWRV